jgi:hypothetical protein
MHRHYIIQYQDYQYHLVMGFCNILYEYAYSEPEPHQKFRLRNTGIQVLEYIQQN